MQVSGGVAEFTVCTANRVYQQQLVEIGFQRTPDDSFARHLSASSDIEYIFENFARHLEEILLQHAGMRPIRWEEALTEFLKRVEGTEVRWWLAGSAALAVRGIDVAPRDLDFAVSDAHVVGRLLEDLLVEPVTNLKHWVAEWFGRAFHGALIEWVSDVHPDAAGQGLEQGPAAASRLDTLRWAGHTVRVTPLDLQLAVAERRGQQNLAGKIRGLLGH
jgi:hypothetical protein